MSGSSRRPPTVVAAIDFGTTCTGYAYNIRRGDKVEVSHINHEQKWEGAAKLGLQAPTTVLMNPDGSFESFGFEAETRYERLAVENKQKAYFYFKHFKMKLHYEKEISRDLEIRDINGRQMKALKVFAAAIEYVKDHLIKRINEHPALNTTVIADDIKWVLTVPAIWRESAKQFMRESAKKAGIATEYLALSLEPEAAAIYCKQLAETESGGLSGDLLRSFDTGKEYILLDLGGGTADTTIHRVARDGTLNELFSATGGPFGGEKINDTFQKWIEGLVTPEVFKQFRDEKEAQWIKLQANFEIRKREFTTSTDDCMIEIPRGLSDIFLERCKYTLEDNFKNHKLYGKNKEFTCIQDYIILNRKGMQNMFDVAIDEIIAHLRVLLSRKHNVSSILLVGGFAESPVVREAVKLKFENKKMRISSPILSSAAILKGAVMFGMDPSIISSRICSFTYGFSMKKRFDGKIHQIKKKEFSGEYEYVRNAFDKHLEIGQTIYMSEPATEHSYRVNIHQRIIAWTVYQSTDKTPIFCDENSCTRIGKVKLTIPFDFPLSKTSLRVSLTCLGTELMASAMAICRKNEGNQEYAVSCIVDFLNTDPESTGNDYLEEDI